LNAPQKNKNKNKINKSESLRETLAVQSARKADVDLIRVDKIRN
jgi:hypothetical protein